MWKLNKIAKDFGQFKLTHNCTQGSNGNSQAHAKNNYSCCNHSHCSIAKCHSSNLLCPDDVLCSEHEMCDIWMHWMLLKRVARMQDSQVHYIEDCSLTHQIVRCIVEFISMAWLSQISDGFNRYHPTSNCQQVLDQHVCSLFIEYHQAIYQQVITN